MQFRRLHSVDPFQALHVWKYRACDAIILGIPKSALIMLHWSVNAPLMEATAKVRRYTKKWRL